MAKRTVTKDAEGHTVVRYKTYPEGNVDVDYVVKKEGENIIFSNKTTDIDGDVFYLANANCVGFKLNEVTLESQQLSSIMSKKDFSTLITTALKSKKIKNKNINVLYLDSLVTDNFVRKNGIATCLMHDIIKYCKNENVDAIFLKAHPIITHDYLGQPMQSKDYIKGMKAILEHFYSKLGFKKFYSNESYMFLLL